ncbi:MAG TPA: trimethylamine methyltransferase family protein [Firmicutes bacterium]|nr:trimethylamine methyltransferase family protein [Bacillota bacterium]
MNLAGQLKVLSDSDMQMVHEKALELLEEKGVVFQSDKAVETFRKHGAKVTDHTVMIPKDMVMKALSQCPPSFLLEGMNPDKNVTIGEGLAIHPAGGEVFMRDFDGKRRTATLEDFSNLQKVYQALDNVDICGYQPVSPSDVNKRVMGLHCLLASFKNSDKPILSPMELETIEEKEECLKLFDIVYGKEGYVQEHYLTWHIATPNSPLFYSEFACEGIRVFAEYNQPITLVSAPMNGITAPIYLYSTVILDVVETLAGLVYAQLVRPGVPIITSATLTSGNMRYATWECASPDSALMLAATVQMYKSFYHLPTRSQTGVTSSKTIDYQAGMEVMQSFLFTALAGVNLTSNSVGALSNLMTTSLEKCVLDDEMISRVRFMINGMNTSEEHMGMKELMECKPCQDFLMADSTMMHVRDGWQPTVSDWRSSDAWEADGFKDVVETAHEKVVHILEDAPESLLDPAQEKEITDYIKSVEKA